MQATVDCCVDDGITDDELLRHAQVIGGVEDRTATGEVPLGLLRREDRMARCATGTGRIVKRCRAGDSEEVEDLR